MWKPKSSDLDWCRQLILKLNEGGMWIIPRTGQTIQIFHSKKELHLIKGDTKDQWLFERTCHCFNALGYKTLDNRPEKERQEIFFERGEGKSQL